MPSAFDFEITKMIYDFIYPYIDILLAMIALSFSFIYGHTFEYVFGIFSLLCTILYFLLNSQLFLFLSIGSLILLLVIKVIQIYNPA